MEDDIRSIHSTQTTVSTLGRDITKYIRDRSSSVSWQGKEGFFMSSKAMAAVRQKLDNYAATHDATPDSTEALAALYAQVNEAREKNDVLQKAKDELVKQLADAAANSGKLKDDWEDIDHKNAQTILALKAEATALKVDLKQSQATNKAAKEDFLKVKHGFDPQAALDAQARVDTSSAIVTKLNNELQARNSEMEHLRAEAASAKQKWQTAQNMLQSEKLASAKMLDDFEAAKSGVKITDRPVQLNRDYLRKVIGDKGIKHLVEFDNIVRTDARDRCYKMLSALKSSNTQPLKGLSDLVQIALDWLRLKSYKVRQQLLPWIELVASDVKSGTVKRLVFYRTELEKLIKRTTENIKVASTKARDKYYEKRFKYDGFFDFLFTEASAWAQVLARRTSRYAKRAYNATKCFVMRIFPTHNNYEVVFDADDSGTITMVDNEKHGDKSLPDPAGPQPSYSTVAKGKGKAKH